MLKQIRNKIDPHLFRLAKIKAKIKSFSRQDQQLTSMTRIVHYLMATSLVVLVMVSSKSPSCQACRALSIPIYLYQSLIWLLFVA